MIEYVYGVNLSYEMIAHNMPSYVPKDDRYGIVRQERQTASTMFVPLSLVTHFPETIPDNVIYYHGPNGRDPASTDHFRTSDDAIKIVFTSKISDLLNEKKKILNPFGFGDS